MKYGITSGFKLACIGLMVYKKGHLIRQLIVILRAQFSRALLARRFFGLLRQQTYLSHTRGK